MNTNAAIQIPIEHAPRPQIICKGTDTQRPCLHYKPGTFGPDCTAPKNMHLSLVDARTVPLYHISHVRGLERHCGPAASWYAADQPF